ncbi:MAG: hypothetical protein ABSD58_10905 [Verrucomicrobiia bacterium]
MKRQRERLTVTEMQSMEGKIALKLRCVIGLVPSRCRFYLGIEQHQFLTAAQNEIFLGQRRALAVEYFGKHTAGCEVAFHATAKLRFPH